MAAKHLFPDRPPPPPNDGRGKPTHAEQAQRVHVVYQLLCEGMQRQDIFDRISKEHPEWGMSTRTTDRYIQQATQAFAAELLPQRKELLGQVTRKLEYLYQQSMAMAEYKVALGCLKELANLGGLSTLRIDLGLTVSEAMDLSKLSDEELRTLSDLRRKAARTES